MKRISIVMLAALLTLTACGPSAQPKPAVSSAASPAGPAPMPGFDKRLPLIGTSIRMEAPSADKAYEYLQKLGDTYGKAWSEYLPGLSFDYRLARTEKLQTVCVNELTGQVLALEPDGQAFVGCLSNEGKWIHVYVPAARLARQLLPGSGVLLAEPRTAFLVAQSFGQHILRYLDMMHPGVKRSSAQDVVVWACVTGITFRATHNLTNLALGELLGWLFAESPDRGALRSAFVVGYKNGRLGDCYITQAGQRI